MPLLFLFAGAKLHVFLLPAKFFPMFLSKNLRSRVFFHPLSIDLSKQENNKLACFPFFQANNIAIAIGKIWNGKETETKE